MLKHFVRQSVFLFLPLFLFAAGTEGNCPTMLSFAHADILPSIEAHQFKVVPIEKSKTGRVYRFRVAQNELPKTASILLIEENQKPTMAFRVLKTDSSKNEFIARRVRRYDATKELKLDVPYDSTEKVADVVIPPPPEVAPAAPSVMHAPPNAVAQNANATNLNAAPIAQVAPVATPIPVPAQISPSIKKMDTDLDQSAPMPNPFDGDLPPPPAMASATPVPTPAINASDADLDQAGPMPTPKPVAKKLKVNSIDDDLDSEAKVSDKSDMLIGDDDTIDEIDGIEVKERKVLNPLNHMLGLSVGAYANMSNFNIGNGSTGGYAGAFTLWYSSVIERNVWAHGKKAQDALNLEYGFGYYSKQNLNGHSDTYNIIPVYAEFRYDLFFSEAFTFEAYLGFQYNGILSQQNITSSDATIHNALQGPQVNVGVGLFYNMGPQWYLRGDLGLDRLAIGLGVKW